MTDTVETMTREDLQAELRVLRGSIRIASDTEASSVVARLIDLLEVADCLEQDGTTRDGRIGISEYCTRFALPAVMRAAQSAPGAADSLLSIEREINDRWGDLLGILKLDTHSAGLTELPPAPADDQDLWTALAGPLAQAAPESDDEPGLSEPGCRLDISAILASLGNLSSDPSPPATAARPRETGPACAEHPGEERETREKTGRSDVRPGSGCVDGDPSGHAFSEARTGDMPLPPELTEQIDDPEMIAAYGDDAQQCLSEMEACLLNLESGQSPAEALRHFCRQLHTLKGASGTVGLSQLAGYLHELENYVETKSMGSGGPDVEMLLRGVDVVRHQITLLAPTGTAAMTHPMPDSAVTSSGGPREAAGARVEPAAVSDAGTGVAGPPSQDGEQFVRIEASRLDRLMDLLAELVMLRNRRDTYVRSLRTVHDELNYCSARTRSLNAAIDSHDTGLRLPDAPVAVTSDDVTAHPASLTSVARLLSRSLAELSSDVTELGRTLHDVCEPLSEDNSAVSHLIGRFRQELMELRRLPLAGLFQRLQRTVRDAARAEGKQVQLVVVGQTVRAERTLQERLFEPLMHLVRNGVSHGIENSVDRVKAGKSSTGTITLETWSDAAYLFIEVRDDGRGMNDDVLEARGRELGLLPAGQSVSRERLWKLIFQPGFSTRATVSQISGRGVGMDVVDSWIRRLRGRIDVESVPEKGTTFRLQIPLRSAIEHAMVVRAGGQLLALPMQSVNGTSDPQLQADSVSGDGSSSRAGSSSRIVHLGQLLGMADTQSLRPCYLSLRDVTERDGGNVAQPGAPHVRTMTVAVDGVVGVEEVVVRSLPPLLQSHELFAGVTLSGRAETVLLLDVPRLIDLGTLFRFDSAGPGAAGSLSLRPDHASKAPLRVLVADDSVTIRRSLSRRLKAAGVLTSEASNGADALKLLRCGGIAAVVTDIDMPRMNGLELLQEIRRQKQFQSVPVIVFTSRDDLPTVNQLKDNGAADVLSKPVTDDTIMAILSCMAQHESRAGRMQPV